MTVTADGAAEPQEPTACGASTTGLESLASQETNPAPLSLELEAGADGGHEFTVRVTDTGADAISATPGHPIVVIAQGGVIVGGLDGHDDIGLPVDLAVGGRSEFKASTMALACTTSAGTEPGEPLPAGEYEAWAVMSFTGDGLTPTSDDRPGTSWRGTGAFQHRLTRAAGDPPRP